MAGRAPRVRRVRRPGRPLRFAIVAARFNERITERLVQGALEALAATGRYAAIVCVGVVIRGQTPHFEHVAREAAAGIREVALTTGVPATFGVVTALSEEQAWARAGGEVGNRGEEAAEAALAMAEWVDRVRHDAVIVRPAKSARAEPRASLSGHPRLLRPRGTR